MKMCKHRSLAIRVHRRTIDLIHSLDDSVVLEIDEDRFFMIYCADSDHEDYETIAPVTYERTYGKMPDHVLMTYVTTIDRVSKA